MNEQSYTTAIVVEKPVGEVYNHIKEISKWWSKDFEGGSRELGDEFIICHTGAHFSKQKLVEVVPNKKLVWLVTESNLDWLTSDQHEWTNTKLVFELSPEGNKTLLHFTHAGLVPAKECYTRCRQGWEMVIKQRLYNFITVGETI